MRLSFGRSVSDWGAGGPPHCALYGNCNHTDGDTTTSSVTWTDRDPLKCSALGYSTPKHTFLESFVLEQHMSHADLWWCRCGVTLKTLSFCWVKNL